ncbi:MAG: hypothetical protein NTY55_03015 [Flavobacteriia bacterium]|nr:hypothetical protein [Flavobacteriia bacterium]
MNYFLAHNGLDIFHSGKLEEGSEVTTGQPYLEYFDTLEKLIARLKEYNQEIPEDI